MLGHGLAAAGVAQNMIQDVQSSAALLMKATVFKYWTEYDGYEAGFSVLNGSYIIPESERNSIRQNLLNVLMAIPITEKKIYV